MEIITNNQPRDVIDGSELNEVERKEFDYIDWATEYEQSFFRYKGELYDLNDCEVSSGLTKSASPINEWSGYYSQTFFSGVVFKYVNDMEQVVVGRYCV